jgi:hypothetical protein
MLLPAGAREPIRKTWTQGVGRLGLELIPFDTERPAASDADIDPQAALRGVIDAVEAYFDPGIAGPPDRLNPDTKPEVDPTAPITSIDDWERALSTLTVIQGQPFTRFLPSVILLRLDGDQRSEVYSLVVNRVYESQYTLVFQDGQALPELYSLSAYPTVVNGFPNLFVHLDLERAGPFLADLRQVDSADAWEDFKSRYAILRNSAELWPFYDWVTDWNFDHRQRAAGYLDLSYYDIPR